MARREKRRRKGSKLGDFLMIVVMFAALCVFVYSGYMLYGYYREYKAGTDEYNSLQDNYTSDDAAETELDALEDDEELQMISGMEVATVMVEEEPVTLPVMTNPVDFDSLLEINDDLVGWIKIRALDLSYPVVQAEDNDYYLHRTLEQEYNFAGCIFMNCYNNSNMTDQNTIIYGHNMKNGSMFGTLKKFREEETYNKSKYFWIFTPTLIYQYRIFSAQTVSSTGITYQTAYSDEDFDEWITAAFENSVVDNTGLEVTDEDKIVTLSTCTGDSSTRFVVMGRLMQIYISRQSLE